MGSQCRLWVFGAVAILLSTVAGCSHSTGTPDPPKELPVTIANPVVPDSPGAETSPFVQRIHHILEFEFEGFDRMGPPRSQIATVPPIWTGERVRGEGTEFGDGAVFLFASTSKESLIIVDIAYVEGLTGSGILRTAWMDDEIAAVAGVCSDCTQHSVKQFYEPKLVYTVTEMRGDGMIYPFTEALMQHLRDNPLAE